MRRTGKNGERTLKRVAKSLLAALMLPGLIALSSCNDNLGPDNPDPNARVLTVRVTVPGMPATKAASGDVAGVDPESMIYNVQVWMFNHQAAGATTLDSEAAVAYATLDISGGWTNTQDRPSGYYDQWTNATTYEVPMRIPSSVMYRDVNDMKFDFYVLANGPSIGSQLSESSTRAQIKAATFGVQGTLDPFGTNVPKAGATPKLAINGSSDAGPGVPISGFFNRPRNSDGTTSDEGTGVDLRFLKNKLSADEAKKLSPVVQLDRAVSKLRFVFAKPEAMDGVSVTRIELDANLIPDATFVFPREDGTLFAMPSDAGYMPNTANIGSLESADILGVEDPTVLRSDSELNANKTAQQYEDYLTTVIGNKTSTQRFAYFRESDKPITGKIYYKLSASDTQEKVAVFTMAGLANTNFYRNHSWLVYSYFQGGKLFVNPIAIADWIDVTPLEYTLKLNTNMRLFDSWLYRYDTDGNITADNYTNWATSHMAVSSGRVAASATEPVAGRPLRSPQIQLLTTGDGTFELTVDNADFEIVRANKNNTGAVTSYDASVNGVLTIAQGDDVYTYFYIVPKEGVTPANPVAKVTLIYNDPVLGPQKVTFNNNSLPGYSDDSSEIWAYYLAPTDYKYTAGRTLRMYFQDYNHPLVPTEVQN